MDQESKILIEEALKMAGEDPKLKERLARLEKRRIRHDSYIPPRSFLFKLFGIPCFPRGELVALTGKEKCGKTYISSMLMALCIKEEIMGIQRNSDDQLRVLWYDTEQSEESTQEILKDRIMKMTEGTSIDDFFDVFNVRGETWNDRLPLLDTAIREFHPDLVILDGIRDLVSDINDGVVSQEVVEGLMHVASDCSCCIVCVLHQNRSAEDKAPRGFLGSELAKKVFEMYECQKNPDRIFSWHQVDTRKYAILDTLYYTIDDNGMPVKSTIIERLNEGVPAKPKPTFTRQAINPEYVITGGRNGRMNLRKLFGDAMHGNQIWHDDELKKRVMSLASIVSDGLYYKQLNQAVMDKVVAKSYDGCGKAIYHLLPESLTLDLGYDNAP